MPITSKGQFKITADGQSHTFLASGITTKYKSILTPNSGMTADGVMHLEWAMTAKREVNITMPPMTAAELAELYSVVQGKQYLLNFYDALKGEEISRYFYTEDTSAQLYSGIVSNGLYIGVAFTAKELGGDLVI